MKGKKLYRLLGSLDAEEFRLLGRAVDSPLMNTNPRVASLYYYLQPHYPTFDAPALQAEPLFTYLFPSQPYDDYKLRRLLSSLSRLVEQFLVYLEAKREEEEAPLLLIRALGRRNHYALFEKYTSDVLKSLQEAPYRDYDHYRRKVECFTNYYFHPFTDKRSIREERLQELVYDMDYRYALEMYRLGAELRNRERILSEQYQLKAIDRMSNYDREGALSRNAIFRVYRSLILAYEQEEDPALFRKLKKAFVAHTHEMRDADCKLLFQQILNYTIRRINESDDSFYKEALELYKMGLQAGWLIDGGRMSAATYSNIVLVSCEEGEYRWAEAFMNEYESLLEMLAREDTKAHCYSLWHYFQEQYDEALQLLARHSFSKAFQPTTRMTAIRIVFEQFLTDDSYFDLLLSQVKAFEKYLSRNKTLAENRKDLHKLTLSLLRRIANAIAREEPLEEIRRWALEEINSGQAFVLRNWLKHKILRME